MSMDWNDQQVLRDLLDAAANAFRWLETDLGYELADTGDPGVHQMTLEYRSQHGQVWVVISIIGRTAEALIAPKDRAIGWGVSHNAFMFVRGWPNPGRILPVGSLEEAIEAVTEQSQALRRLRDTELSGDYSEYERALKAMRSRIPDYATGS
jgi:hypothetical protein